MLAPKVITEYGNVILTRHAFFGQKRAAEHGLRLDRAEEIGSYEKSVQVLGLFDAAQVGVPETDRGHVIE